MAGHAASRRAGARPRARWRGVAHVRDRRVDRSIDWPVLLRDRRGSRGGRGRERPECLPSRASRRSDGVRPLVRERRAASRPGRRIHRGVADLHTERRPRSLVVSRPRSGRSPWHAAWIHRQAGNSMTVTFDPEVTADEFRGRRVTIVGLGKGRTTGGLARFLVARGATVTVSDRESADKLGEGLARLQGVEVKLVLGPSSDDLALADPDFVFVIPGIRPRSPTILRALQRKIPVLTEMALFFRLCRAPIVGVTGTKGKTTTTTLIELVLSSGRRRVVAGGNIGTGAPLHLVDSLTPNDIVVLELSSFQLETLAHSPHVAVVTNVLEDHLDHHGTRDAYIAAKKNIVAWQGPRDIAVLNLDDPSTVALHTGSASEVRGFSLSLQPKRGAYLDGTADLVLVHADRRAVLCKASDLRVPGRHNVANALAAAVVGDAFDIPSEAIGGILRAFEGVPRRLQPLAEKDGVLWVNDSAATTPAATLTALAAYDRPAVVILGGVSKGADFSVLARALADRARGAVLIGRAADEIASAISAADPKGAVEVRRAATLDDAVAGARAMARAGDVVLLSPACASFDMFSSADERGEKFAAIVRSFTS